MGENALITSPSLWALLPIFVYVVLIFSRRKALTATFTAVAVGFVLTGQTPASFSGVMRESLGSFLALIGFIIMLGSGLGELMTRAGVSQTIVHWIVEKIGVDSEKKGILAIMLSSTVICALLGTLAGGNAIIAPILIPVVASVGITPSTVGALFQSSGETGLIWGPFTPPVIALMGVTGLSYWEMMKWAALPFGIIWLIVIFFTALKIQKSTKSWDKYEDVEKYEKFESTQVQKRATLAFVLGFAALIAYGMISGQKTNYVPFVMLSLCFITGISARMKFDDIFSGLVEGMSKMAGMFLLFVLLDTFLDMVYLGGGFEALSEILNAIIGKGGRIALMIVGSFVGAFGVEGAAVAQIKITHELFAKSVEAIELPMEMWAIALIAASRITSSVYPTANMIGQMGIARSKNLKAMLVGGWAVSIAALLYIFFWSFLGFNIFF